ncbi:hypothetical protein RHM66_09300 [Pseudomonas sp. RTB3]|nr:hypothetical protein RHM66_09300 [Pseudomonas sp. RTB3]
MFLTQQGEGFSPNRLTQLVREHIEKANIGKRGSCHLASLICRNSIF